MASSPTLLDQTRRTASPVRTVPTPHDPCVHASHPQFPAHGRVDPAQRVAPEARAELGTSGVGLLADLQQRRTDRKTAAGRQRLDAQVEVHVELIARERPAVRVLFDRAQDPRADQRDLALRGCDCRPASGCCRARTSCRRPRRTSCRARPRRRAPAHRRPAAARSARAGRHHAGRPARRQGTARSRDRSSCPSAPSVADPGNPRDAEAQRRISTVSPSMTTCSRRRAGPRSARMGPTPARR